MCPHLIQKRRKVLANLRTVPGTVSAALRRVNIYIPRTVVNSDGMNVRLMDLAHVREGVCTMARMSAERDLVVGMGGNWSGVKDGIVALKASGFRAATLTPEQCPLIDLKTGDVIPVPGEKVLKPSCEKPMHLAAYITRPDVRFVCHTHPTYATAFATMGYNMFPFTPDFVAVLKTDRAIPAFNYVGPASDNLAKVIASNIRSDNAVLMGNHGLFTVGGNALEAFDRTHLVEEAAKTLVAMIGIAASQGKDLSKINYALSMEERLALLGSDFERYRQELASGGQQ